MTKINRLVLRGFKSFAKRTELVFNNKFNCVLGPNGSGKSNILDAICFVLGRTSAKSLRAEKSSNLIYNGGKTKKPANECEVSIFFDNLQKLFPIEAEEIKVTRLVKADGQSVYRLNDKRRTRQEVLDLLSVAKIDPDGYNIILQGDIIHFTEMNPVERRQIIEDIAGIGFYEEKKQKALNELQKVDEKLKEADIILTERAGYLKELKKDRDQALKYKELSDRTHETKASYLYKQIDKKEKENETLFKDNDEQQKKFEEVQKQIDDHKKSIEERRNAISEITDDIETKSEKEQLELNKSVEQIKIGIATNTTKIEAYRNEISKIKQKNLQLKENLENEDEKLKNTLSKKEEFERQKESCAKEEKRIAKQLEDFKKKHGMDNLDEIEKEIEKIDKEIEEKGKEAQQFVEKKQDFMREKDRLEMQIQSIDEKIDKVNSIAQESKEQVDTLKKMREKFKKSTLELNQLLTEDSSIAAHLGESRKNMQALQEELSKLMARQAGIREKVAGNIAVQKILEQKSKFKVFGTVSELGTADEKYALALEIAAGNRVKSLVVEDDKTAAECIKYLKANRLGSAAFIPLNKIKSPEINEDVKKMLGQKGVHDLAVNMIEFDPKFKKVFSYVFGDSLVVDNIEVARKIGIGKMRMVTVDGDMTEMTGVMRGGWQERKEKGLFQENDLNNSIKKIDNDIAVFSKSISDYEEKRMKNEERIAALRTEKANLEGNIIKLEKTLHLESGELDLNVRQKQTMNNDLKKTNSQLRDVESKIADVSKEIAMMKIKKQDFKGKIGELKSPTLLAELNTFNEKRNQLQADILKIENELKGIDLQVTKVIHPEKERIKDLMEQHVKDIGGYEQQIESFSLKLKEDDILLKDKENKAKEFNKKFKLMFDKRNKLNEEILKIDSKVEDLRESSKKVEIRLNVLSMEATRIREELGILRQDFRQYEGVKINTSKSEQELKQEIDKFERMVANLGNVNMRALEIYDVVEKEYNTLLERKDGLRVEKDDVMNMIAEVDRSKKDLFMGSLNAVQDHFQRIFSALLSKGEASLVLEDENDPFAAGLLIKVRLTGTKFLDIRSLSGGEKTMTALSFIFAIQEHEPAKFYVLDEVDAALDKKNSDQLAKLIKKYCDRAQYVVISHNDALTSEADILYGIYMDEHGISNVASLKI